METLFGGYQYCINQLKIRPVRSNYSKYWSPASQTDSETTATGHIPMAPAPTVCTWQGCTRDGPFEGGEAGSEQRRAAGSHTELQPMFDPAPGWAWIWQDGKKCDAMWLATKCYEMMR